MNDRTSLKSLLLNLDGRTYQAYKDIKGSYRFPEFILIIERVQGDPFASPSKLIAKIPKSVAGFPETLYSNRIREIAFRDYLTRQFDRVSRGIGRDRGSGKSGLITIPPMGQEILERTTVLINENDLEIRFLVGLPARGRSILGRQAAELLCEDVPDAIDATLKYHRLSEKNIREHVETAEDADYIRAHLVERNLIAFIANGSILPRRSGIDDRPLVEDAVPFQSPPGLEVAFTCPNRGEIKGMGIAEGITLIVGGGYHGKSTLLRAIERGVYNHIPGDGREFAITNATAVKIRAEDGRSIAGVNISPFIKNLPGGRSTTGFSTANASGSTSQAANIIEALEAGTEVLLIDEDTTATNFMIRDARMQKLIASEKEPITPFIDKVRYLFTEYGVSTILVIGGSGDYFEVADRVIAMEDFQPRDVTEIAKEIALEHPIPRYSEGGDTFGDLTPRIPLPDSIDPGRGRHAVKFRVRDVDEVAFGTEDIDLGAIEQIVDPCQLRAIVAAIVHGKEKGYIDRHTSLPAILSAILQDIENDGLDILTEFPQCDLAMFRRLELAAVLNRLRTLRVK
ncbi:ABC-ATPase domain-containing protein [Pannus brasiliensis CCIBt3594]|uniref:ABC-ATPase domain-containing protein n=1 Tax=Pannus brasiliensis CCIBt3594 TaxID=1427578 RepID=A0AAW9QLI0_9CHRO